MARAGRRIVALCIDWGLAYLVAAAFFDAHPNAILAVFAVEQILLVGTIGYSIGHRIMGIVVTRLDGGTPGFLAGSVRALLLCLVIPAVIVDADHRGLHDKAMKTVLVRR